MPLKKIKHQILFSFCMTMLVGLLFLGLFVITSLRSSLTDQVIEQQRKVAFAIQQGLSLRFGDLHRQLWILAENPVLQSENTGHHSEVLYEFLDQQPVFRSAFVYDKTGKVLSLAYRNRFQGDNGLIGKTLMNEKNLARFPSLTKTFLDSVAGNNLQSSEGFSSVHRGTQLAITLPIRRFGNPEIVIGVLSVGIHLYGAFFQELAKNFQDKGGFFLLTDQAGLVLGKRGDGLPDGLERVVFPKSEDPNRFESTWTILNGKEYLVTVGSFSFLKGYMILGNPREKVLAIVDEITWGILSLSIFSLFFAGICGWILGQHLLTGILLLIEGTQKVGQGILTWRIENPGRDELGDACKAFNSMAENLEKNRMIEDIWSQKWNSPDADKPGSSE